MAQRQTVLIKIGAGRRATLPKRLIDSLQLYKGDSIEMLVRDGEVVNVRLLRAVVPSLFTPEVTESLDRSEARIDAGQYDVISDLSTLSNRRVLKARAAHGQRP
jgi:bifunctional DNA-binding transcriptional regulator/antitoxin component of YhaV-PrlF toxin-antitoxin module